jgi:hypothetical protein
MKKLFFLMVIILTTVSCEKDKFNKDFTDNQSIQNLSGTWKIVSYEDLDKNTEIFKSDVDSWNGLDVILTFTLDSLYGRNTTNTVYGNFTITDRNIHILTYGGTKIMQPEWGSLFSSVVYNLESFKVNQNQLRFFYNKGKNSITLDRN